MDKLAQLSWLYDIYCRYEDIEHLLPHKKRPSVIIKKILLPPPLTPLTITPVHNPKRSKRPSVHPNRRQVWVSAEFKSRDIDGFFAKNFLFYKSNVPEEFFNVTNLTSVQFDILLQLVKRDLSKKSIRRPISPACRLALSLTFLTTGIDVSTLSEMFKMGKASVREIVYETTGVLWSALSMLYGLEPNHIQFKETADEYQSKFNVPNCVGSLSSRILNSEWPEINRKGLKPPIMITTSCDSNLCFNLLEIGRYFSTDDVYEEPIILKSIRDNNLNLPPDALLSQNRLKFPYYFVANTGIPLQSKIMIPYGELDDDFDTARIYFNDRISALANVNENAMGLFLSRWKILQAKVLYSPENLAICIKAAVALHNFAIMTSDDKCNVYCPPNYVDHVDEGGILTPGQWRHDVGIDAFLRPAVVQDSDNSDMEEYVTRERLKLYLDENSWS